MENWLKRIKRFIEKNRELIMKAIRNTVMFFYIAVFASACYALYYDVSLCDLEDMYFQRGEEKSEEIYVIGITDEDIEKSGDDAAYLVAEIADRINSGHAYSPSAIVLDIPLSDISEKTEELLLSAGKKHDNLIIAAGLGIDESLMLDSFDRTSDPIVAESVIYPDEVLQSVAEIGHSAKISDKNAVIRHAVFDITDTNGNVYSSVAEIAYKKYCQNKGIEPNSLNLSKRNTAIIKFTTHEDAYTFSADDILSGNFDSMDFDDKIVVIGYFSTSLDAGYVTAIDYRNKLHSAEIDADIINNLLNDNFATVINYRTQIHILVVMILIVGYFTIRYGFIASLFLDFVYMILLFLVSEWCYGLGYESFILPHILNAVVTSLLFGFIEHSNRNKNIIVHMRDTLKAYVGKKNVNAILDSRKSDTSLGLYKPEKVNTHKIAVLFADIRGFTTISENMAAEALVGMLNEYLSMMAECIEKYGGTLDKFIGDCAMAYWGYPEDDIDAVYHACLAASEMQRRAAEMLKKDPEYNRMNIHIGIGINYGDAVVGNIGSENRRNFTAVGDTVNTASRIEGIAEAGCIYLSEYAYEQIKDREGIDIFLKDGNHVLKGRKKDVDIYELKSISIASIRKETDTEETGKLSSRHFAALVNLIVFIMQISFACGYIYQKGINYLPYFNVNLSLVSAIVMVLLIAYELGSDKQKNRKYRPHWLDVLLLSAVACNLKCFVAMLIRGIPLYGVGVLDTTVWAGGFINSVIAPALVIYSFFILEYPVEYSLKDIFLAELPQGILLIISCILAKKAGLDVRNPDLYNIYFKFPVNVISIVLELLGIYGLTTVTRQKNIVDKLNISNIKPSFYENYHNTKVARSLNNDKSRRIILLVLNIISLTFSTITILNSFGYSSIFYCSNVTIVMSAAALITLVHIIMILYSLFARETVVIPDFYSDVVFGKLTCCMVAFFFAWIIYYTHDESLYGLYVKNDFIYIIFCLVFALIDMDIEKNECHLKRCMIYSIPCLTLVFFSNWLLNNLSFETYGAYVVTNPTRILTIFIIVCGSPFVLYALNNLMIKVGRYANRRMDVACIYMAGTRKGVSGSIDESSEFGMYSDCYVIKDGEYAIVIGAGSGLKKAKELVKGCTRVDILVNSAHFPEISGFLGGVYFSDGAAVKIYSVFDFNKFSLPPFWPVDKLDHIREMIEPDRRIRLNSTYSCIFVSTEDKDRYTVKIYQEKSFDKEVAIGFTDWIPSDRNLLNDLTGDTFTLVLTDYTKWEEACNVAVFNNIPKLIISGFPLSMSDEEIRRIEKSAKNILMNVTCARKKDCFNID